MQQQFFFTINLHAYTHLKKKNFKIIIIYFVRKKIYIYFQKALEIEHSFQSIPVIKRIFNIFFNKKDHLDKLR